MDISYYGQVELASRIEELQAEGEVINVQEILEHEFIKCDCGHWVLPGEKSAYGCVECLNETNDY